MSQKQCRICGRFVKYLFPGGLCYDCNMAEYNNHRKEVEENTRRDQERRDAQERERQRERQRQREREEERARQEEMEWQRREDEERHHREMMELEERHHQEILDLTLPWFPCSHCGNKTRQDKIKEVDGKKFCGDCASKIRECQYCHKNYVMEKLVLKFKKDEDFVKKSDKIVYNEYVYGNNHKYAGKISCKQYDAIEMWRLYMCPSCKNKSMQDDKEMWETSKKLKVEYERLKSAKEKADREEKERQEREEERRRREEEAKREIEEAEEKARKEAAEKKFKKNTSAGCLGLVLFAVIAVALYMNGASVASALIFGGAAFALSMLFRSITSHLFVGLIFAAVFEFVFGLIISIISYFVWDAFLVPLGICFVVFLLLFTILSATGVIDKQSEGSTPFDAIGDFLERFR